jgi:hypothetical protein
MEFLSALAVAIIAFNVAMAVLPNPTSAFTRASNCAATFCIFGATFMLAGWLHGPYSWGIGSVGNLEVPADALISSFHNSLISAAFYMLPLLRQTISAVATPK